ncbi:hypothetical protein ABID59_001671 [Bradyrhizobium sp. S3.3.6]|uniref:hypothetical protein n=1 Tax=Bradyrhizobium sp. S3.3.6 TaxID=3156429 RepID=UPI003393334D
MLPDEALKSMKVMFATPCYISAVSMHYVTSIFELTHHCNRFGLQCILHMHSESLITRSRNKMVIKFLSDETLTHLFWIDSDLAFTPQSVCRLLLIDRDVTAGIYPMKNFNWPEGGLPAGTTRQQFEDRYTEYPFNPIGHGVERISTYADADGFAEVAEAPTGFMCVKRDVFKQMMEKYPELNYVPDGPPNNPLAHLHWLFFDCMVDPESGRYLSEDYAFCRRWRDIGGKIWVDLQCKLLHLGQHNFRGDLEASLRLQGRW